MDEGRSEELGEESEAVRVSRGFIIGLLILFQLWLVAELSFPAVNLVKIPFRREQRAAAIEAFHEKRSPENEAAMREEFRLASKHVARQAFTEAGVLLGVFLGADAIVIYLWRRSAGVGKGSSPPTQDVSV